jgi:hypothetical protein
MTEEEILNEYKKVIDEDIANYCKNHNFDNSLAKEAFANSYKKNFVKGFYRGKEESSVKCASRMLEENLDHSLITSLTGLSTNEILKLNTKTLP